MNNQNNEQNNKKIEYEDDDQQSVKAAEFEINENTYHFQTKIHNSGFWGDDRRRRGTWLVGFGIILLAISIVMIAVFWRWWYGHYVNVPCRIAAITLLICGIFAIVIGLISNALMEKNRESKHFLGAPPRWSSWLLLCGLIFIIIAADFITFYYSYWHNRFINTPFIITSIILFFFGIIFVCVGLKKNMTFMKIQYKLVENKGPRVMQEINYNE
jgi:glucan phosphoethanolaminetransferase (alkaline phosphatase superfamily)